MSHQKPARKLKPVSGHPKTRLAKFDIFLAGVGGLGVLTLGRIVAEAGLKHGFEVKTCETHGLAQRYGAINAHIRFGRSIHSALIPEGQADLVIGLEPLEALRTAYYSSREAGTVFLVNTEKLYPTTCFVEGHRYMPVDKIVKTLEGFSRKVYTVNASQIVKKEMGSTIYENIYLLGMANGLGLLPVYRRHLVQAFSEMIRKKFVAQNIKVFKMGERKGKEML
ncbi:MAG: indolepyruvate oxidoreductase subunit beta [Candidatus Aenigmatarchaeota archaeon]